jgi:hypothetical protein
MTDPRGIRKPEGVRAVASRGETQKNFAHALLFTGHMIDRADRARVRFPASAEGRARAAIYAAIAGAEWTHAGTTVGVAGGASGGDLLFHECCEELGIPTRVLLALDPDEFEANSVAPAGPGWVKRFRALLKRVGDRVEVMRQDEGGREEATGNVWQRANLWMMEEAIRLADECALLALWDGGAGDEPGGTEDFLQAARARGIRVLVPIEMRAVF